MKFLVVTNRKLVNKNGNEKTFGEDPNTLGASEIRFAWAEKTGNSWSVTLVSETAAQRESETPPSRELFENLRDKLCDDQMDCLFYVHGYNKSFEDSLEQSHALQERYTNLAVVCFSWPANPGGFIPIEYRRAQTIADHSSKALDRIFDKMGQYMRLNPNEDCEISFNLLVHSLGNYLLQKFIEKPIFSGETRFFDNIILHQPDVDNKKHVLWVDKLRYAARIYVTINERDAVLDSSDVINADRLGNTLRKLKGERATYINFTGAKKVKKAHQIFGKTADKNQNVKGFFDRAFQGEQAEIGSGITYEPDGNYHQVK